jgi:hypothetical protein
LFYHDGEPGLRPRLARCLFEVIMPVSRTFAALLLCASVGLGADLHTLAGTTLSGELTALDDKAVTLKTDSGNVATPLLSVLDLVLQSEPPGPESGAKYLDVELTDGSVLHCKENGFTLKGKEAEIELTTGVKLKVPLESLAAVLRDAHDAKVRDEWKGITGKKGTHDVIAVRLEGVLNRLEGTIGEGDAAGEKLGFEDARLNRKLSVPLTRVQGMVFVRKLAGNAPDTLCKVTDLQRNTFTAHAVALAGNNLQVTTVTDLKLALPVAQVASLDFSGGRLLYLSDVNPVRVVEKSNTGRVEHYRRNKNLEGGEIRLHGEGEQYKQPFPKGLSVHAYTELVYDLGGQYKKFEALLGVDETVEGDSRVKVIIEGDGKELYAAEISRKDEPKPVKVDVKDVKELRIVIRSADLFDFGNHVDLASARVSK